MAISVAAIRNNHTSHRGWSTHLASRRYRQAQPNRKVNGTSRYIRRPRHTRDASTAQAENVFVAIRKAINNRKRGRTRRSAPTRSLNRKDRIQDETDGYRDASTAQAVNVFVAIRKAINNRNARADTAVRPYAEFCTSIESILKPNLRLTERTSL